MSKSLPTITIRLHGNNIRPEKVGSGVMAEIISQVQSLASGSMLEEKKNTLHLLDVVRKSAGYQCYADDHQFALGSLAQSAKAVADPDSLEYYMVRPFHELSTIAKRLEVSIDVLTNLKSLKDPVLRIQGDTYSRIRGAALIDDEASISGELVRVGGATDARCALRIPDRQKLLYCSVGTHEIGRQLGSHLYQYVTLHGTGTFFAKTWEVFSFRVNRVTIKKRKTFNQIFESIRSAGGDGWDRVEDVERELENLR